MSNNEALRRPGTQLEDCHLCQSIKEIKTAQTQDSLYQMEEIWGFQTRSVIESVPRCAEAVLVVLPLI